MAAPVVFVGGVDVSYACLQTLCNMGVQPALAIGYDDSWSRAAGFADLGPLAKQFEFDLIRAPDINDLDLVGRVERLRPALVYVIGWSQIVRPELLAVPAHGCVGIHPTRLPEGRGRAPIPWTILKGLERTASTMFFLTEGVDEGAVIGSIEFRVDRREDAGTLYAKHRAAHVELVLRHTRALIEGAAHGAPQDESKASVWPRRTPEDGRIDWREPAESVDRLVRAVTKPYPGAFTDTTHGRVTIWRAEPGPSVTGTPGRWFARGEDVFVTCGERSLRVLEVEGHVPLDDDLG